MAAQQLVLARYAPRAVETARFATVKAQVVLSRVGKGFYGRTEPLVRLHSIRVTQRRPCPPQANELNIWGDRDGRDEDAGQDGAYDAFDRGTLTIITRVLTQRAVQRVLLQLQETNLYAAQWLADFCNEVPPSKGDEFLAAMFRARPENKVDKYTNTSHYISPSDLANRILVTRAHQAGVAVKALARHIEAANLALLRGHLEAQSYTSGSWEPTPRKTKLRYRSRHETPNTRRTLL